jgi:hypothetical protein
MRVKNDGRRRKREREREREREKERREETVIKSQVATPKRVNTNARRCCHATIGVYACNHSFTPSFLHSWLPNLLWQSNFLLSSLLFDLLISHQC